MDEEEDEEDEEAEDEDEGIRAGKVIVIVEAEDAEETEDAEGGEDGALEESVIATTRPPKMVVRGINLRKGMVIKKNQVTTKRPV